MAVLGVWLGYAAAWAGDSGYVPSEQDTAESDAVMATLYVCAAQALPRIDDGVADAGTVSVVLIGECMKEYLAAIDHIVRLMGKLVTTNAEREMLSSIARCERTRRELFSDLVLKHRASHPRKTP